MDRETRTVVLAVGIVFCVGFAALTVNSALGARFGLGTVILAGSPTPRSRDRPALVLFFNGPQ